MSRQLFILYFSFFILLPIYSFGQNASSNAEDDRKVVLDGQIVVVKYDKEDTLLVSHLEGVSVSVPRNFEDVDEYIRYQKYKRYAIKVYPFAIKAIKIFREVDFVTKTMKKRKRKKHIKRLHKNLKKEFTKPLKNLSKTQGKILIEMIEKELDTSFYQLMKGLRGGFTASYWNTLSKIYGYQLKEKYTIGADKILDAVLYDLDVSHKLN